MTGLVGAYFCGPRIGRFEDGQDMRIPGHDISRVSLGTLMLWFGKQSEEEGEISAVWMLRLGKQDI